MRGVGTGTRIRVVRNGCIGVEGPIVCQQIVPRFDLAEIGMSRVIGMWSKTDRLQGSHLTKVLASFLVDFNVTRWQFLDN